MIYDRSREGLAEGCCSSIAPCSHQQHSPYTICRTCTKAMLLRAHAQGFVDDIEGAMRIAELEAENARLRTAVDGAIAWHAKRADVHDTHQMLEHDEQANRLRNAMDPNWRIALEEARGK